MAVFDWATGKIIKDWGAVPTKVSDLNNDSWFITSSYHDSTKQDTISDLATIRAGAGAGATAVQPADVLTKTNTTAYTPTANYHPATKKYIDDIVGDVETLLAAL